MECEERETEARTEVGVCSRRRLASFLADTLYIYYPLCPERVFLLLDQLLREHASGRASTVALIALIRITVVPRDFSFAAMQKEYSDDRFCIRGVDRNINFSLS